MDDVIHSGLEFDTGRGKEILRVEGEVLSKIAHYRQTQVRAPESGGMLFARIEAGCVRIVHATEPNGEDKRSRFSFTPALKRQQAVIESQFKAGLHFVGEWHTHPEPSPTPSGLDLNSMNECFRKSTHQLKGLVMLIVGTSTAPDGLWVSLHDADSYRQLSLKNISKSEAH